MRTGCKGVAVGIALGLGCRTGLPDHQPRAQAALSEPAEAKETTQTNGGAKNSGTTPLVKPSVPGASEIFMPPGPEPAPGPEPVFAAASEDRYGAPLPRGAVARLGSTAGTRSLRRISTSTDRHVEWFYTAYKKRHAKEFFEDAEFIVAKRTSADGATILLCDYNAQSACDLMDVATQSWLVSIPALDPDHIGFFYDAWFIGSQLLVLWNDITPVGPVDPTKRSQLAPDLLRVHRITDGSQTAEAPLPDGAKVFPGAGHVLVTVEGKAQVYPFPELDPPRDLDAPKATGRITWAASAANAARFAAYIEPSDPSKASPTVVVWDAGRGATISEVPLRCKSLGLAPDARSVACVEPDPTGEIVFDRKVTIVDPSNGQPRRVLRSGAVFGPLVFSASGDRLTASYGDPVVEAWDLSDGSPEMVDKGHMAEIEAIEIAPDGEYAAVMDISGEVRVWRLRDQTTRWRRAIGGASRALAFSGDGSSLLVAANDTCMLVAITRADGTPTSCFRTLSAEHRGGRTALAVDGMVAAVSDSANPQVWLMSLDGGPPRSVVLASNLRTGMVAKGPHHVVLSSGLLELATGEVTSHPKFAASALAHLGGDLFLVQDRRNRAVARDEAKIVHRYVIARSKASPRLSKMIGAADGRVAIADEDGAIAVFDSGGHRIARFDHEGGAVTALAFHPTEPILLSGGVDANVLAWRLNTP